MRGARTIKIPKAFANIKVAKSFPIAKFRSLFSPFSPFSNRNGIMEPSYPLMLQQSKMSENTRNLLEGYFRAHGEDKVNFSLIAQLLEHLADKEALVATDANKGAENFHCKLEALYFQVSCFVTF